MLESDPRFALCRQAAMAILARHGWRLLDEAPLAAAAAVLLAGVAAPTRTQAERACQQVYARTLYAAARDPTRQAAAYRELHAYLYRIARHQQPDLAEDAAQEAIVLVYQNGHTCRDPAAFLKFAIYQLLTAFHRLRRGGVDLVPPAVPGSPEEQEPASELPAPDLQVEEQVAEQEKAAECLRWLRAVIAANPRARNQIWVVAMKYLEGRDDREIAAALGTTVANVQVLRSRGLEKLREEHRKRPAEWTERFAAEQSPPG